MLTRGRRAAEMMLHRKSAFLSGVQVEERS